MRKASNLISGETTERVRKMIRCPVCLVGELVDVEADVYEDVEVKKVVIRGRCNRCGTKVRFERRYNIPQMVRLWRSAHDLTTD